MTDIGGEPYSESLCCLNCNAQLLTVTEYEGRTAIVSKSGGVVKIITFRAELTCFICGTKRQFYSELLSGMRLGIVDR